MLKIKQNLKKFFYSFKKSKIKAVHEKDLLEMLKSMGVLEKIERKEFTCIHCKAIIDIKNIEAIFFNHGKVKFICSNLNCVSKL